MKPKGAVMKDERHRDVVDKSVSYAGVLSREEIRTRLKALIDKMTTLTVELERDIKKTEEWLREWEEK